MTTQHQQHDSGRTTWVALLFACATACGGGGGIDTPDGSSTGPDGMVVESTDAASMQPDTGTPDAGDPDAALRIITGTEFSRHITPSGVVAVPVDLSEVDIAALVPPGFDVYPGTGLANGTFTIPDVPEGTYYLKVDDNYLVRSSDSVELDTHWLGRSDAMEATASPTNLVFDVTNLSSWQDGDVLQLFSAGSGTVGLSVHSAATANAPSVGETALAGLTYDLTTAEQPMLIDGAAGDVATLSQLVTASDGSHSYQALARIFHPESFTVADGGTASLSGSFTEVPQDETLAFDWDLTAFDDTLRASASPNSGGYSFPNLAHHVLPGADAHGAYSASADLLLFSPGWTADPSDVAGSWAHGDAYPESWSRVVTAFVVTYQYVQVGSATPMPVFSELWAELPQASVSAAAPIVPIVGPVTNATVNGIDAMSGVVGAGTAPVVSWDPPAVGTADRYRVVVAHLVDDGGATRAEFVAAYATAALSVELVPDSLEAGQSYVFFIDTVADPNIDFDMTPYLASLPSGLARIATEVIVP